MRRILLLLLISAQVLLAQDQALFDSLKLELSRMDSESLEKAELLTDIAYSYLNQRIPDSTVKYQKKSLKILNELRDTTDEEWVFQFVLTDQLRVMAQMWEANFYEDYSKRTAHFENILLYFDTILPIVKRWDSDKSLGEVYNNRGIIYSGLERIEEAKADYFKAMELGKISGHDRLVVWASYNLIPILESEGSYQQAVEYGLLNLEYSFQVKNDYFIMQDQFTIGSSLVRMSDYDQAIEFLRKAFKDCIRLEDKQLYRSIVYDLGSAYHELGALDSAWKYLKLGYQKERNESGEEVPLTLGILSKLAALSLTQSKTRPAFMDTAGIYFEAGLTHIKRSRIDPLQAVYFQLYHYDYLIENDAYSTAEALLMSLMATEGLNIKNQLKVLKLGVQHYSRKGKYKKALDLIKQRDSILDLAKMDEEAMAAARALSSFRFNQIQVKDSLANHARQVEMTLAHEEEVQKQRRTRNYFLWFGLALFLGAIGLWSRLRLVRRAKGIIEKEKLRSEELLLNILPSEIAEELKSKGRAEAQDHEQVTVLFTDFKDFSSISSKINAQELVAEVNHCFEAFDGIMEKFGIEKIKTIGDAYMAAAGLQGDPKKSAVNCVLAGLEMQAFIAKRKLERAGHFAFDMRLGIHTGPLVSGIVGVKKFQYDLWGDTVNIASRMESHGEIGKVNLSENTFEIVQDQSGVSFEERAPLAVKGMGQMKMWFVSVAS